MSIPSGDCSRSPLFITNHDDMQAALPEAKKIMQSFLLTNSKVNRSMQKLTKQFAAQQSGSRQDLRKAARAIKEAVSVYRGLDVKSPRTAKMQKRRAAKIEKRIDKILKKHSVNNNEPLYADLMPPSRGTNALRKRPPEQIRLDDQTYAKVKSA